MKRRELKDQLKKELSKKEKRKEVPSEFINKMAAPLISVDLHIDTIYQLCKVRGLNQALDTMYETTIKQYKLHEKTIQRMMDKEERSKVNEILNKRGLNMQVPIL